MSITKSAQNGSYVVRDLWEIPGHRLACPVCNPQPLKSPPSSYMSLYRDPSGQRWWVCPAGLIQDDSGTEECGFCFPKNLPKDEVVQLAKIRRQFLSKLRWKIANLKNVN